jgi:hypothetical protein
MQDMIDDFCTKLSISIPKEDNPFNKALKLMREVRNNLKNDGLCVAHLKTPVITISPKETVNVNNSLIKMTTSAPKRTLSWRDNLHTIHEFIIDNLTPRVSNESSPNTSRESSPRVSKESSSNDLLPRVFDKKSSHISSPLHTQLSQLVLSSKTPKPDFNF